MTETVQPKCPICRKSVSLRKVDDEVVNPSFPFCSEHCRMNDLGNWLDEAYALPIGQDGTERSLPNQIDPTDLN